MRIASRSSPRCTRPCFRVGKKCENAINIKLTTTALFSLMSMNVASMNMKWGFAGGFTTKLGRNTDHKKMVAAI